MFRDPVLRSQLAFRGGTALHKLYLPPPIRYSEDIDLVQLKAGPIGGILDSIRKTLSFLGHPRVRQKGMNNTMVFSCDSEIPPIVALKLKVEINCREHFSSFKLTTLPFTIESRWFSGECELLTYNLEELLGSKLRALYQRKKGRDLFDLWYALTKAEPDLKKVIQAFQEYMKSVDCVVTRRQFSQNLQKKLSDPDFEGDILGLLRPEVAYHMDEAYQLVNRKLIEQL